jgi:hypothetical protein
LEFAGKLVVFFMAGPPQPPENDTSVAQSIQFSTRMFNPTVLVCTNKAI